MPKKSAKHLKKTWTCNHCNKLIDDKIESTIKCDLCFNWLHVKCTSLSRTNFNKILKNKLPWKCNECEKINSNAKKLPSSSSSSTAIVDNCNEVEFEIDLNEISHEDLTFENSSGNEDCDVLKCIRCMVVLLDSYQYIFDEVGKELDLKTLLSQCFEIDIEEKDDEQPALCSECVYELIETYDLIQKDEISCSNKTPVNEEMTSDDSNSNGTYSDVVEVENMEIEENMEVSSRQTEEENLENDGIGFENVLYLDHFDEEFDFRAYKKKVIKNHKFHEINFPEEVSCRICSVILTGHLAVLNHIKEEHYDSETGSYICVIDDACEPIKSFDEITYHLVFTHYDLDKLVIITQCPECNQFFNNFCSYNKHSCDTKKRYGRSTLECEICGKLFKSNKRYRFHLQFHLEKRRPKACFICDKMFRDEDEFFEHVKYFHEKNIDSVCQRCDMEFTSKENLENHIRNSHNSTQRCSCMKCFKTFASLQQLKQHLACHEESQYKCEYCDKTFTRKSRLGKHILLRHRKPVDVTVLVCNVCGLVSLNEDEAEVHLSEHPDKEASNEIEILSNIYTCEHCQKDFSTIGELLAHRKCHPSDEFICSICKAKFNRYSSMSSHKYLHALNSIEEYPVIRNFICGISGCIKSYKLWASLYFHRNSVHEQKLKSLTCPKCDIEFSTYFSFKSHIEEHKDTVFDCMFCSKSFKSKSALTLHAIRIHGDPSRENEKLAASNSKRKRKNRPTNKPKEKNFNCSICNKPFYNQFDASFHERSVHCKEARFFCDKCCFKTPYRQTLNYHMRTHTNIYAYECSRCARKFRYKNACLLHEKRHDNVKNFVCDVEGCGMSYINAGRLKTHKKLKHSGDEHSKLSNNHIRLFDIPVSDTFIDDDDGLDDGIIGEPVKAVQINSSNQSSNSPYLNEESQDKEIDVDDVSEFYTTEDGTEEEEVKVTNTLKNYENETYIVDKNNVKSVIVIKNENDCFMKLDHTKVYGRALEGSSIEETELGAIEIVVE